MQDTKLIGIYFLYFKRELVYIGKSIDLNRRIHLHSLKKLIQFDFCSYIILNECEIFAEEKRYIQELQPKHNIQYTEQASISKQRSWKKIKELAQQRLSQRRTYCNACLYYAYQYKIGIAILNSFGNILQKNIGKVHSQKNK